MRSPKEWAIHFAWILASVPWLFLAATHAPRIPAETPTRTILATLQTAPLLVIAAIFFVRGTGWSAPLTRPRSFAAALGGAFLVLGLASELVALLPTPSGLTDPAVYVFMLEWFVVGLGYLLSSPARNGIAELFEVAPSYPLPLIAVARWLDRNRAFAAAWFTALLYPWLDLSVRRAPDLFTAALLTTGPVYLTLLVPAAAVAVALANATHGGVPMTTDDRNELLARGRVGTLSMLSLAGFVWSTGLMWAIHRQLPLVAVSLAWLHANMPNAVTNINVVALAGLAGLAIVVHYTLLVELPYSWGQRSWRAHEVARTGALVDDTGATILELQQHGTLLDSVTVGSAVAASAAYMVARDRAREAQSIPTYTFDGAGGLARKLATWGLTTLASTLLGVHLPIGQ